jgi:hypothetical protein
VPAVTIYVIATRTFVIAALAAIVAGCQANYPESPTPSPTVVGLQLQYYRAHSSIRPGETEFLIAYALNSEGIYENVSSRAAWSSSNAAVAAVTGNGYLLGIGDGTASAVATYQGLTASTPIVVRLGGPPLDVPPISLLVGGSTQPTVRLEVTRTDVTNQCTWTSADSSVVSVDGGRLTGRAPGTTKLDLRCPTAAMTMLLSVPPIDYRTPLP